MQGLIALITTIKQSGIAESNLLIAAVIIALVMAASSFNWRISVLCVGILSVSSSLLLLGQIASLPAITRAIVGICATSIMLSAAWRQRHRWRWHYPRVGLVLVSLLLVYALVQSGVLTLPIAPSLSLPVYTLIVLGVGLLVSADHLLYSIIGLFLILIGSDMLIAVLIPSTTLTMVFAILKIALALVTAWMTTDRDRVGR